MNPMRFTRARKALAASIAAFIVAPGYADPAHLRASIVVAPDPHGLMGTLKIDGPIDRSGPFFQSLGTNGRSCATCHDPEEAMSFTPAHADMIFATSRGKDPLFASVDGANCDSVAARDRAGHSLILQNGLLRIALPVPPNAEFSISVVSDPYGCALRIDPKTHVLTVSVYRRPLPATNLSFLSAVMSDGRETIAPLTNGASYSANLRADLTQQAIDATRSGSSSQARRQASRYRLK